MDLTKSLLRNIKDTITRNNDLLDDWNAERGIRTERMDMKDELAALRAEIEQLRRERDATRNETLDVPDGCLNVGHQVQKTSGYPFPGEVRSVFKTRAGLVRYVIEATGEDYAGMLHIFSPGQLAAIRNLKEPSDD